MNTYYCTICGGQESRGSFTEWLWLRFFHETAVKMLVRVAVIQRLDRGWEICFQNGSFTWLLAGSLLFLSPTCTLHRTSPASSQHGIGFSKSDWAKREQEGSHNAFMTLSQKSHTITPATFSLLDVSHQVQLVFRKKGTKLHPLRRGISRTHILKSHRRDI